MTTPLVNTKETDYLDEDKPIRGQNYVCLSFISPEDVLANKDVFVFEKYVGNYVTQLHELFANLKAKFPEDGGILNAIQENNPQFFSPESLQDDYRTYKEMHSAEIDSEFLEKNDFRTSMRGIKVRGTFDTLKEAQNRAEILKKMGDKFDIFVAQVGCWCPWSPFIADMENAEYAETQLNTLMKKYKENMSLRDEFFETRKQEKMEAARKQVQEAKTRDAAAAAASVSVTELSGMEGDDIWLSRKNENPEDSK